jgi:hypothetical protein
MHHRQREAAYARLACGEETFELHEQPPRREQHAIGLRHRSRQLEPRGKAGRRHEEQARLGNFSERAVELGEQPAAEPQRHAVARQAHQFTQRANAEAAQKLERVRLQTRDPDRQRFERISATGCAPERSASGRGESERCFEAELREAGAKARLESPDSRRTGAGSLALPPPCRPAARASPGA